MYNANKPRIEDLPSPAQLKRSSIIAAAAAVTLLITVVLPAEYGIDPTRAGRLLGLTEMGEIKSQLAEEADQDQQATLSTGLLSFFVRFAQAQEDPIWTDEVTFRLSPGQGAEWKLSMQAGAVAQFSWYADQGVVNYDLHGDAAGQSISYEKGRGVEGGTGSLQAQFTGSHGWFWRNRSKTPVTITLRLTGAYDDVQRTF